MTAEEIGGKGMKLSKERIELLVGMTADEMLNELGYKKAYEGSYLRYEAKDFEDDIYFWVNYEKKGVSLNNANLSVLKAVTEKCKELGWD